MDTILKLNISKHLKLKDSISLRVLIVCAITSLTLIIIFNVFTFERIKSAILADKQTELISAVTEYSASLSDYGLSYNLNYINTSPDIYKRIIVTDDTLRVLYDSAAPDSSQNSVLLLPSSLRAVRGEEYTSFSFIDGSLLESCVSAPVVKDGTLIGTVSIFETDKSLAHILDPMRNIFITFSTVISLAFLICAAVIIFIIIVRSSRMMDIVHRTEDAPGGELSVQHSDEFSPVIHEFNEMHERFTYMQQMRQVFVSDASHELRTPLAAIKLLCESITQTENMDPEMVREFMEDMILEVDRMSHTAEKLLVLSKLDNPTKNALAPISLSVITENMVTSLSPIADAKDVTIETYIDGDCCILGDIEGANQIIGNLIDNAIKYNNVGGTLRIYLFEKNDRCTFITDDTGIGIAPEHRDHIFERFYRVDKAREHDGRGGSGLGLAIVKRNVESFGGTIEISDSVYGGTRFTVVFPSLSSNEEVDNK